MCVNRVGVNTVSCEIHYHFRSEWVYTPETGRRKVVCRQKELAHSSTTLLTISKSRFSKAKQTGMLTTSAAKVGRG